MDRTAAQTANWLVGNPLDTPVLEITLMGPTITITGRGTIALTGADLAARLDRQPAPRYETIRIDGRTTLSFSQPQSGCRAYLAVRGKWLLQPWLHSYAAAEGLTPESFIRKGQVIHIRSGVSTDYRRLPPETRQVYPSNLRVRVLPGPEFADFSPYAIGFFFSRGYRLNADSNRMGYRLNARLEDFSPEREIISSAVLPGTIQVTNAGQPIILMADAQTTGGYPRLANVISADLDRLAQLKPGDELWFSLVRLEEARDIWRREMNALPF